MPPTPGISINFWIFRYFGFSTHGMCRYGHFEILDFSSKIEIWRFSARLLLRRSFLGRTAYIFQWKVHIWVVRTYIFYPKVHIWVVRTLYFLKKSSYLGRKSSHFLKAVFKNLVVNQFHFWNTSSDMNRTSVQFLKRVPITWVVSHFVFWKRVPIVGL